MSLLQFPIRRWSLLCALCFATACAADPGDASKTTTADGGMGIIGSDSGAGGGLDSGGGNGLDSGGGGFTDTSSPDATQTTLNDSGGGGIESGLMMDSGGGVDAPSSGPEASIEAAAGPEASIPDAAKEASPPVDAGPDCLKNIPASCPDCMTMNASDKPNCELYIACYMTNSCDPSTACGSNDGVCGVNKIGGGSAPQSAAVATYMCACP
jgi:hypothetical protein